MAKNELATSEQGGHAGLSLHQRILEDVRARILSGEWAPGHRIPYEHELTRQYNCSRMTVNKALSELAKSGLIERRRRSGSFVRAPHLQSAVLEIHDVEAEVAALGLAYRYVVETRRVRKITSDERKRLALPAGSEVVALTCRHFAGSRPFCMEERIIALSAVPEAAGETFESMAPSPWLVSRVPWSVAEHRIRAAGADRTTAQALEISEGTACLIVERTTWIEDRPITFVQMIYAGDSNELVARFAPSKDR